MTVIEYAEFVHTNTAAKRMDVLQHILWTEEGNGIWIMKEWNKSCSPMV